MTRGQEGGVVADALDPSKFPPLPGRPAAPPPTPPRPRRVTQNSPAPMSRVDPDDDVEPRPSGPSRPLRARETPPADDLAPEEFEDFEDDEDAPRVVSRTPEPVAGSRRDSMLFTIALILIAANVVVDAIFIWLVLTR